MSQMSKLTVSSLSIYPVKSCRGVIQNSSWVEKFGLKNDRRWMVVDEQGVMITQRKIAKMCLIQPELTETGLILKKSGMKELAVDIPSHNKKRMVTV